MKNSFSVYHVLHEEPSHLESYGLFWLPWEDRRWVATQNDKCFRVISFFWPDTLEHFSFVVPLTIKNKFHFNSFPTIVKYVSLILYNRSTDLRPRLQCSCNDSSVLDSGGSRIFLKGTSSEIGCANLFFAENYMKMKECGCGGGEGPIPGTPLDPPVV